MKTQTRLLGVVGALLLAFTVVMAFVRDQPGPTPTPLETAAPTESAALIPGTGVQPLPSPQLSGLNAPTATSGPSTVIASPAHSRPGLALPRRGLTLEILDALEPISPANVTRLRQVGLVGNGIPNQVAWSPDGKWLAAATSTGVYFYDTVAFEPAGYLNSGAAVAIAFSPADSARMAVATEGGKVALWDVSTASELRLFGKYLRAAGLTFSPDGKWLAASVEIEQTQAGENGVDVISTAYSVPVWDVASGQTLRHFQSGSSQFAPDGSLVISDFNHGKIHIWDVSSGKEVREISTVAYALSDLEFSPDGKLWSLLTPLMGRGSRSYAIVWDMATGREERHFDEFDIATFDFVLSPNGALLEIGGVLLDASSGQEVRALEAFSGSTSTAFSPDGKWLASAGGTVAVWDVDSGTRTKVLDTHVGNIDWPDQVVFSPRGDQALAVIDSFGDLELWDLLTGENIRRLDRASYDSVGFGDHLTFLQNGAQVMVRTRDNILSWDVTSGEVLQHSRAAVDFYRFDILISPDGQHSVVEVQNPNSGNLETALWDMTKGEPVVSLGDQSRFTVSVEMAFSPDGALWAVASGEAEDNRVVTIYEVGSRRVHSVLTGFAGRIEPMTFSANNSLIAVQEWGIGSSKSVTTVWNVATGQKIQTIEDTYAHRLTFSADGNLLAIQTGDPTAHFLNSFRYILMLWDVASGQKLHTLRGPAGNIAGFGFAAGGRLLVTVEEDQIIRLWGVPKP